MMGYALIKKQQYWPRHVHGDEDEIKEHFDGMNPGDFDALKGRMNGVSFYICGMKEPDYVLLFMTTYGTPEQLGQLQKRKHKGTSYQFQYPEVCHMHYSNRDSVDNHNSRRMSPIAIEEQLKTTRWPMRCFQYLLAVTEVNANLANSKIFGAEMEEQLNFRYALAEEMISNSYIVNKRARRGERHDQDARSDHKLESLPPYKTFRGAQLVECRTKYIQLKCTCDTKLRVQTYCRCSPGVLRCQSCYDDHILSA